ncbi:NAD(P)H-dependent flavin oxidoreductase [Candidatus Ichthyocystis hellenicum]|uniref:NAD(P)H-dependent flavin oxidoreductase n=1 Tax=Candidatus Ichthyocystis hellenicum TaxID=1561003 RepID=UPI000AC38B90|nr:nitronate monooxygenase family protein [Candidatus Ichthyocystis hellenicum]
MTYSHSKTKFSCRLPVICAPMFIVSNYKAVIEQCLSGVIGTFPSLNARPEGSLTEWCSKIEEACLQGKKDNPDAIISPYGVNLILDPSNTRLEHDIKVISKHKVPLVITSLRAPKEVVHEVHSWGGLVFHDAVSKRHAEKAAEAGADGIILVCSGSGGHCGSLNPFAFIAETRQWYDGVIVLAGSISSGRDVLAARILGADFSYMGTRFIATQDTVVPQDYKEQIVSSGTADIMLSSYFTGIPANYLKKSIELAGLNPNSMPDVPQSFGFSKVADEKDSTNQSVDKKVWKDIWSAGHGAAAINDIPTVPELVDNLCRQYEESKAMIAGL